MPDELDYYAILGVPREASATDIRRAFRSLAKTLHPDINPADASGTADYDFGLLTKAYETLKDDSRRRAYDDELNLARQLSSQAEKPARSRHAFAAGLAIGILFAVFVIGTKVYLDRQSDRAIASKSQDSLRAQSLGNTSTSVDAVRESSSDSNAKPRALPIPLNTKQITSVTPVVPPSAAPSQAPAKAVEQGDATSLPQTLSQPVSVRLPSPSSDGNEVRSRSAFAESVLSLERTLNTDGYGIAAYRLVSLVSASTNVEELNEALVLVNRPQTRDLINGRIETLKSPQVGPVEGENRSEQVAAPAARFTAPQEGVQAGRGRAAGSGIIEIAVGTRTNESVVRVTLGNGLTESFADCPNCPEMVAIPGGQAVMGSRPGSEGYRVEEAPAHRIFIRKPLAISKYRVSTGDWRACVDAGVCKPVQSSLLATGVHVPVTRVSWFDAKAYVEWLSQTTGRRYRLLSEAEWEYAAAGGSGRSAQDARSDRTVLESIRDAGVLSFRFGQKRSSGASPSAWGIHGLGGHILEWVEDCWHGTYDQAPSDASPWLSSGNGDCAYRVVRGTGMAGAGFGGRRSSARAREFADSRAPTLGFRVARDIPVPTKTALDIKRGN